MTGVIPETLVELSLGECESLLRRSPIGRLGFSFAGEQYILPVNYKFHDGEVVFRTSLGRKLHAISADKSVAFEVDRWDRDTRSGWSVLVRGTAAEIDDVDGFKEAESLGLRPWAENDTQDRWVRLIPRMITGRRIA